MRLELASFEVKDIAIGKKTELADGTLVVNKQEIRELILQDRNFQDVSLDVIRPGESARVVHTMDAIQPRWKLEGPGNVFPGFVGPPTTVGQGKTNCLRGMTVLSAGEAVPGEATYWREGIVDMSGPGAQVCPFSKLIHLTLDFKPDLSLFATPQESKNVQGNARVASYQRAVSTAECKVAAHLARVTTVGKKPSHVEAFDLGPCEPSLPKVACVRQVMRHFLYGQHATLTSGTVIHPFESFDGALFTPAGFPTTALSTAYLEQNNEVLLELCKRHGKELNFVGYVLFGGTTDTLPEKERASSAASNLVKLLGAQAAVIMGNSDSNAAMDFMYTVQKCERMGIKTTLIYKEVGTGAGDPGFVFSVPEADAIVCVGSREQEVTLPPVKKVIGGTRLMNEDVDAAGEIRTTLRFILGANNLLGMNYLTTDLE